MNVCWDADITRVLYRRSSPWEKNGGRFKEAYEAPGPHEQDYGGSTQRSNISLGEKVNGRWQIAEAKFQSSELDYWRINRYKKKRGQKIDSEAQGSIRMGRELGMW